MCSLEKQDGVFILTLSGEGEHRFNPSSIDSILSALAHVNENAHLASALITTNDGNFFSNGLDLRWVSEFSDSRENRFQILGLKYVQLLTAVMELKLPSIAAVCGHAAAGGFIFALAHDYRFMRKDRGFLYMSEVDVGVVITPGPMSIIRNKVDSRHLTEVLLGGRKYTAPMAFKAGLVDSVHVNSAETLKAAMDAAVKIGKRNWNKETYLRLRFSLFPEPTEKLLLRLKGPSSPRSRL